MREFKVKVNDYGEVFIKKDEKSEYEFVSQMCWDNQTIGLAIAAYFDSLEDDK